MLPNRGVNNGQQGVGLCHSASIRSPQTHQQTASGLIAQSFKASPHPPPWTTGSLTGAIWSVALRPDLRRPRCHLRCRPPPTCTPASADCIASIHYSSILCILEPRQSFAILGHSWSLCARASTPILINSTKCTRQGHSPPLGVVGAGRGSAGPSVEPILKDFIQARSRKRQTSECAIQLYKKCFGLCAIRRYG